MLFVAIGLEICGLSLLKVFSQNPALSKIILIALMNLSYFLMSLTLRQIAVGVAYATWEIVGGIGVLLVSFVFFDPHLSTQQYFGIIIGFVGIVCIILGEEHCDNGEHSSRHEALSVDSKQARENLVQNVARNITQNTVRYFPVISILPHCKLKTHKIQNLDSKNLKEG